MVSKMQEPGKQKQQYVLTMAKLELQPADDGWLNQQQKMTRDHQRSHEQFAWRVTHSYRCTEVSCTPICQETKMVIFDRLCKRHVKHCNMGGKCRVPLAFCAKVKRKLMLQPTPWKVKDIEARPMPIVKEWHKEVRLEFRDHTVQKIFTVLASTPYLLELVIPRNTQMSEFAIQAVKIELEMFKMATSKNEYHCLIANKIYNMESDQERSFKATRCNLPLTINKYNYKRNMNRLPSMVGHLPLKKPRVSLPNLNQQHQNHICNCNRGL
ncbi:Hypothetical predicted protein [Cloeon dipterum]|uniref:KIX domain-containing protein n=1 Tax=Cloeon dipterum TaxID=197152 RepID=A0A8S1BYY0_9INSE|nr:Hypothetical predicted protein [Cloeon dipterum]